MKYCLSGRQKISTLRKCDEIKVWYQDLNIIYDFIENEDLQQKTIILDIPKSETKNIQWDTIKSLSEKIDLIVCLHDITLSVQAFNNNLRWYWAYPAFSWYDLRALNALKPCYIIITAPLSMSLDVVKSITDTPLRMVPNIAYDAYLPRENGIRGQWVRPEDTKKYEQYIDAFEFLDVDLTKEATLFHVYAENCEWPGNLNLLISNLNFDIDNRAISDELINARMTCGQRCMSDGRCRLCESEFKILTTIRQYHHQPRQEEEN